MVAVFRRKEAAVAMAAARPKAAAVATIKAQVVVNRMVGWPEARQEVKVVDNNQWCLQRAKLHQRLMVRARANRLQAATSSPKAQ